ncbi:LAGLIDADG endonuclease [uncultured archaeon]|nr:LAGLIDADG endonuclease [uncultured archaeon]
MNFTLDPNYVVGFVDGEGCFSITVNKHHGRLSEVRLIFAIELEESDEEILEKIAETIGCGKIYRLVYKNHPKWKPHCKLKVGSFKDIDEKVIPFFTRYPLQAKKKLQFARFCRVARLIKEKKHLGGDNIKEILRIRKTE